MTSAFWLTYLSSGTSGTWFIHSTLPSFVSKEMLRETLSLSFKRSSTSGPFFSSARSALREIHSFCKSIFTGQSTSHLEHNVHSYAALARSSRCLSVKYLLPRILPHSVLLLILRFKSSTFFAGVTERSLFALYAEHTSVHCPHLVQDSILNNCLTEYLSVLIIYAPGLYCVYSFP